MFKVNDFFGIIAGMFVLILVFLILNNGKEAKELASALFAGTNQLTRSLQGRT